MRGKHMLRATLLLGAILLLAACLVIPTAVFTENPYSKEKLRPLSAPGADRNLVRTKFGNPVSTRENKRFWFYTNSRSVVGIIGGTGGFDYTDDDWLVVEFGSTGKVVYFETADVGKCSSKGICLEGDDIHFSAAATYTSIPSAKENECTVYLFLEKLPWPLSAGFAEYLVDGKKIGVVNTGSFLSIPHASGKIRVSAYDMSISTECTARENLYIKAIKKRDWSWKTAEDLAPVSAMEGSAEIGKRRLSLPY